MRRIQGLITSVDTQNNQVTVELENGDTQTETFDALLIASGVTNGFWRTAGLETLDNIEQSIQKHSNQLKAAKNVSVIGGGATGTSVAANLATEYPDKEIHFFYSQAQPLPGYHKKVRKDVEAKLKARKVYLYPQHRAIIPDGLNAHELCTNLPVHWQDDNQPPFQADVTLWAVGNVSPNSSYLPPDMLNEQGFVKTDKYLRAPGYDNVFAVGDIAATDPNRSSARNWGYQVVAHNIRVYLKDRPARKMKAYKATQYRWGSVLGVQDDGLTVYNADGSRFRFGRWTVSNILFPHIVRRLI